jgi:hypothetical protein
MNDDEYISGPHHFWIHFWCGLVVGALIGGAWSWRLFDSVALSLLSTVAIALAIAYCCGRWGDSAWRVLIEFLGRR